MAAYFDKFICPKCGCENELWRRTSSIDKMVYTYCINCKKTIEVRAGKPNDKKIKDKSKKSKVLDFLEKLTEAVKESTEVENFNFDFTHDFKNIPTRYGDSEKEWTGWTTIKIEFDFKQKEEKYTYGHRRIKKRVRDSRQ